MTTVSTYPERVCRNILPLSLSDNLPEAFSEWRFTGHTHDYETATEVCELCDQDDLRYHFEIQNQYTSHTLNVGSHCILKFEVPIYEEGRQLSQGEAKQLLDKLTKKMRLESCVKALEKLAEAEDNKILRGALDYYRRNKKLSPKLAFVVFWKLEQFNIDHSPSFFSVNLSRQRYVTDLEAMPTDRVHKFWPALSSAQRKKAIELGHCAPALRKKKQEIE